MPTKKEILIGGIVRSSQTGLYCFKISNVNEIELQFIKNMIDEFLKENQYKITVEKAYFDAKEESE